MTLTFSSSPVFILLIVIVAAAVSYIMYRGTKAMLPNVPRYALTAFRFVVLTIIGILLLEPLLNSLTKIKFPPIVAVVQDVSESLVIQKDSAFVQQEYPQLLQNFAQGFASDDYAVDLYQFGTQLESDLKPDSMQFKAGGTNISGALKGVQKLYQNQNLGAIVLVSDGISTAGTNPLYAIDGIQQPVYTVLLGDTTLQKDIRIKEVLYNEISYLNTETPVKVKVQNVGFENAALKVSLMKGKKRLDVKDVTLNKNKPQAEVDFLIKPDVVGLQQYQVVVSRMDGEISYRNNSRSLFINVLETRVKIALFAGSPHPDIGALRNALKTDDSYELSEFILKETGKFYEDPSKYNLNDFDLFILHNFPNNPADKATVDKIVKAVKEQKKPVFFFVGQFTDLRTMKPLFDYMSITPNNFSQKAEEVIANFSPRYRDHSTYTFSRDWLEWVNNAPPVFRNKSEWEAKKSANVFATAKIKNIELDYPVYALQSQLGRKNAVFLGEGVWRMRSNSFIQLETFDGFDDWLFNNIKWLMVSDDKRKFKVRPSKSLFTGNEPIIFKGQTYDESYNPLPGVEVKLTITSPDRKENVYYMSESNEGQYFLEVYNLAEGTYSYKAEGAKNNVKVGTDQGQFSVGQSSVEHYRLRADLDLMQQLALRTGGEFIFAKDMSELPEKIKALPAMKPVVDFKKSKDSFHHLWWILVLTLLLLSVEWVTRKVYSML